MQTQVIMWLGPVGTSPALPSRLDGDSSQGVKGCEIVDPIYVVKFDSCWFDDSF